MPQEEETQPVVSLEKPSLKDEVLSALTPDASMSLRPAGIKPGEVTIKEARQASPLRLTESQRTDIRIAFITSDTDVLTLGTSVQQHYADLAEFVGEIHLMVLKTGRGEVRITRPKKNVWIYQVPGRHPLEHVHRVWQTGRQHLRFNGVVQPDVFVGTDPFTAGLAAWWLAKRFTRPWQLHIRENVFSVEWLRGRRGRKRLYRLAKFLTKRATSVQVANSRMLPLVQSYCRARATVSVMPHLYNLAAYRTKRTETLRTRYPQYRLLVLAEGYFTADSALHDMFAGLHPLLHNPWIGLLVRGSGPAKSLFTEKAQILGITEQVVWLDVAEDPVVAYQSADVFVETGTDSDADERVLRAITAGTAVVCYRNDFRESLIVDGENGFLIDEGDPFTLGRQVQFLINDSARRAQFALRAKGVAADQLHEDLCTYFQAYRDSVASAIAPLLDQEPAPEAPADVPADGVRVTEPPPPAASEAAQPTGEKAMVA
jgi:glycosyltransferase involved in cell wall biosynthesis